MSVDCCRSGARAKSPGSGVAAGAGDAEIPVRNVVDLQLYGPDTMGETILSIYGRKPTEYAVYRTPDRVKIQYADDNKPELNASQRKDFAQLNPIRGEINGCIDGWRLHPCRSRFGRKAERYDRRVGDALVVAFEGDVPHAQGLLDNIKKEILDERTSIARFEYLVAALFAGILISLLIWLATTLVTFNAEGTEIWRAAAVGSAGAFFSIALWIRWRTVLPDLQIIGNTMDAMLRIVIGVMGAAVLIALISSGAVTLAIGGADFSLRGCAGTKDAGASGAKKKAAGSLAEQPVTGRSAAERSAIEPPVAPSPDEAMTAGELTDKAPTGKAPANKAPTVKAAPKPPLATPPSAPDDASSSDTPDATPAKTKAATRCTDKRWLFVLLIGFIAGFAERLVPDLLAKATATTTETSVPAAVRRNEAAKDGTPNASNTSDRTALAAGVAAGGPPPPDDPDPDDTGEDHCACDIDLPPEMVTPDTELPAASGGVAPVASPAS